MKKSDRMLLSGNEAVALAAMDAGVALGAGYPGTPSTEILEEFSVIGGKAQWAPNEKVALEVGLGAAFAGARALVTMKHVGVNVAADPLFTAAYTGVTGSLVLVSADDPGLASSQNEQDNRHYAEFAGIPMLEPSDSQEAYDFLRLGMDLSRKWGTIVMLRMTTRVCHSKTVVRPVTEPAAPAETGFARDIRSRVMVPAFARDAHRRMRERLRNIAKWNETSGLAVATKGGSALGIISSGVAHAHALEAAPEASHLKLGMTWPLPLERVREFAASVERCLVIEEGERFFGDRFRAAGIAVESAAEPFRYGELDVARIRRIVSRDETPEEPLPRGKPPQLCVGCPHRTAFEALRDMGAIVAGDIGCYTLGVLPPFDAMDTCVCMGASIGVGLGLRHALPDDQARRVVSVIGDSTFVHSGLTGIVEMVYNPPATGHVVLILDNGTTAMTGLQEHPGTGRRLDHASTGKVDFEAVIRAMGVERVGVVDPIKDKDGFRRMLEEAMWSGRLEVIIARRPCLLAAGRIRQLEAEGAAK